MKTLLWLGNPFFFPTVKELLSCPATSEWLGDSQWNVVWRNPAAGQAVTWQDCVTMAGASPDVLVVGDTSRPPFVLGMENFPCRTALYAVDTHIHSWLPWYGQAFDACLVSLRDHMEFFRHKILPDERLLWSPPYAHFTSRIASTQYVDPRCESARRPLPCFFAGSLDPVNLPMRHHFLTQLGQLVPQLRVVSDSYTKYYPSTRIVVNICEYGDLNFRVMESMGCGAALVTPAISNGLTDLFQPGKHLQTFEVAGFSTFDNPLVDADIANIAGQAAECAAQHIGELLRNEDMRLSLARNGWKEIQRGHRAEHRAHAFMRHMEAIPDHALEQRRAKAELIRSTCLKLPYLLWCESLPAPMRDAYIKAARGEL